MINLRRILRTLLVVVPLAALLGCSQGVSPIDPREPGLPTQTRKWLAAAQDGVLAARARRDAAHAELGEIEAWADRTKGDITLDDRTDDMLSDLANARVSLAELNLEIAEREVDYAEAKLDLTYAERAVHHDLGSYDLEPLKETVAAAREAVAVLVRERIEAREEMLTSVGEWWGAYARYAEGGGDTRSYWIGDREPITEVIETEEESSDEDADDAEDDDAISHDAED